jgi:RNA polymerase sigma-70 factor (ECF subfamily)
VGPRPRHLIGFLGDFDLAEEAAQEAFAIAAERWPRDGVPANPGAWLVTTARNRAIDRIRRDRTLAAKTRLLDVPEAWRTTMTTTTTIPTSGSSSSSPAATRRSRSRRRSR